MVPLFIYFPVTCHIYSFLCIVRTVFALFCALVRLLFRIILNHSCCLAFLLCYESGGGDGNGDNGYNEFRIFGSKNEHTHIQSDIAMEHCLEKRWKMNTIDDCTHLWVVGQIDGYWIRMMNKARVCSTIVCYYLAINVNHSWGEIQVNINILIPFVFRRCIELYDIHELFVYKYYINRTEHTFCIIFIVFAFFVCFCWLYVQRFTLVDEYTVWTSRITSNKSEYKEKRYTHAEEAQKVDQFIHSL